MDQIVMNCLKEPCLWLFPEPIWQKKIKPIFHLPPCFFPCSFQSSYVELLVKVSLFHTTFTLELFPVERLAELCGLSLLKKNTWELQQMQGMLQAILYALHKIKISLFLSTNIFRIFRTCTCFQDWDLRATGVLLFRICTLITYTDLIHNF